MSCNCQHRAAESPEQIVSKVKKGTVKFCDVCDPCNECVTNVKICAFVVPTLEEGRYFKNSFIFVQEDDSVYFISDDRSEIPFGSRPKFIDDFDPTDAANHFKNTVVYDVKNNAGYVYDPQGNMTTIAMSSAPFSSLTGGEGIIVTATGGDYTVAIDPATVASADDLHTVTLLVTNHTGQINALQEAQDTMAGDIETIEDEVSHVSDLVDDANELAVEAKENAAAAQQTANEALSGLNNKQDRLTAGDNISILNNEISATDTTYDVFTGATAQSGGTYGLVPGPRQGDQNKVLSGSGGWVEQQDTTYTAGTGLNLNGTEFSVDTATIAKKSDIPTVVSAFTNDAGYQTAADVAAAINAEEVPSSADWNAIFTASGPRWAEAEYYPWRQERVAEGMGVEVLSVDDQQLDAFLTEHPPMDPGDISFMLQDGVWMYEGEEQLEIQAEDFTATTGISYEGEGDSGDIMVRNKFIVDTEAETLTAEITSQEQFEEFGVSSNGEIWPMGDTQVYSRACKKITLGPEVTAMGDEWFNNMEYLEEIDCTNAPIVSIGNYVLYACDNIKSPIVLTHCKTIGNGFLNETSNFNTPLIFGSLETIGNEFMSNCYTFNQPIDLSTVKTIGRSVMYNNHRFNQPINLSSVQNFGYILGGATDFANTIDFGDKNPADVTFDASLSSGSFTGAGNDAYATGITFRGTYAQQWLEIFPSRSSGARRNTHL